MTAPVAMRTVWIAHTVGLSRVAGLAVDDLIGGCQFVATRESAGEDLRSNGGGKIYRVTIAVDEDQR
jgi:hypothetical protein